MKKDKRKPPQKSRGKSIAGAIPLHNLFKILDDGTACFSILPYCEEYHGGIDKLKTEEWYRDIKNKQVKRIVTIGGGAYPVETCIELEGLHD